MKNRKGTNPDPYRALQIVLTSVITYIIHIRHITYLVVLVGLSDFRWNLCAITTSPRSRVCVIATNWGPGKKKKEQKKPLPVRERRR